MIPKKRTQNSREMQRVIPTTLSMQKRNLAQSEQTCPQSATTIPPLHHNRTTTPGTHSPTQSHRSNAVGVAQQEHTRRTFRKQQFTSRFPSPAGSPASGTETARRAAACTHCRILTKNRLSMCCRTWMKRKRSWKTCWLEDGGTRWFGCSWAL